MWKNETRMTPSETQSEKGPAGHPSCSVSSSATQANQLGDPVVLKFWVVGRDATWKSRKALMKSQCKLLKVLSKTMLSVAEIM